MEHEILADLAILAPSEYTLQLFFDAQELSGLVRQQNVKVQVL